MAMSNNVIIYCLVEGIGGAERADIKEAFSKFGQIKKVYINPTGIFAKVYYNDSRCCKLAVNALRNNLFGWEVNLREDNFKPSYLDDSSSTSSSTMTYYWDCSGNPERYYTIHGTCIETLSDDSGNLFVNLDDIKRTGFALFTLEELNAPLNRREIVLKDFYNFLLNQAGQYLKKSRHLVEFITEDTISNMITKCQKILLGDVQDNTRHDVPFYEPPTVQRAPRELSANFVPTHRQATGRGRLSYDNDRDSQVNRNNDNQRNDRPKPNQNQNRSASDKPRSRDDRRFNQDNRFNQDSRTPPSRDKNRNKNYEYNDDESSGSRQKQFNRSRAKDDSESWDNSTRGSENSDNDLKGKKFSANQPSRSEETGNRSVESPEEISEVNLEIGKTYNVTVAVVEKENIVWVQEQTTLESLQELTINIESEVSSIPTIKRPRKGQLALAKFEETWWRCRVTRTNPTLVHFIDFGNKTEVDELKVLPEKFRTTPASGIRLTLSKNSKHVTEEEDLTIKVKNKYDDKTYLVDIQNSENKQMEISTQRSIEKSKGKASNSDDDSADEKLEAKSNSSNKEIADKPKKCFFELPKPLRVLKNGDQIKLMDRVKSQFAVKTKECIEKAKEISDYIRNLDKSTLLLNGVEEGQLVLCAKDGASTLCRAVVVKKDSPTIATVKYLDYPGEEKLTIKSLRNVDDYLSKEAVSLLFTPKVKLFECLSDNSMNYVETLVERKAKVVVVIANDNDFDIKLEDGSLLSQKLLELETPEEEKIVPAKQETPKVITSDPVPTKAVMLDEMDALKPQIGSSGTYMSSSYVSESDITLVSMEEEVLDTFQKVAELLQDIDDTRPYSPELLEMCLVWHKAAEVEDSWYRGAVKSSDEDGYYDISLVDVGGMTKAKKENIRRFPDCLKKYTMLGIFCELVDIPEVDDVKKKLQTLMLDGSQIEVTFKSYDEETMLYQIVVPEVYAKLKK